jgi:peptidoglycan/LPS O-acetylase OafA/YrhL
MGMILFISLFAMDSFEGDYTVWEKIAGFMIHMIPSFVLVVILIIAWKWELAGGILLIVLGFIGGYLLFDMNFDRMHSVKYALLPVLLIAFPIIVSGFLFLVDYYKNKKTV